MRRLRYPKIGSGMSSATIKILATVGCTLICIGSFVAISAPGDGQTGMVTFPLWLIGGALGIVTIVSYVAQGAQRSGGGWLILLGGISIGSVIWSFAAASRYETEWHHARREGSGRDAHRRNSSE